AHHHSSGNVSSGKIRGALRIENGDGRYIVVAQGALQRRSKREHRGFHHSRVIEAKEVSDLVSDHSLQIAATASVGGEIHRRIKENVGVQYLAGKARHAAMLVGCSR